MVRNPATNTQINTNELKIKFVTLRAIRGKIIFTESPQQTV
jgi:hypothetical protein